MIELRREMAAESGGFCEVARQGRCQALGSRPH
jgi:hypothetical protein